MRVCAVICEYNPFHLGHAYHLRAAREASSADYVLCLMSGALTQRGAFARHDKWLRARAALENGADVVLELPARFACSPAPDFAGGGVALLAALGVVTHLSFGCEPSALPLLSAAPLFKSESPDFSAALQRGLADGLPYPRARALAAEQLAGIPADLLAQPNAALALEYLQALPETIVPVPVARRGSGYHDASLSALSSATAVRTTLARGSLTAALTAVPSPEALQAAEESGFVHEEEALTQALLYRLRTASPAELAALYGMDEGLENRFIAAAQTCSTREALLDCVKTRRYTRARLSRLCAYALLNLTRDFAQTHRAPDYARVLGFRKSAAPLLKTIKQRSSIPLITKAANFDRSNPLFALDVLAQDLWSLGVSNPSLRASGRDFTTSPAILSR